MNNYYHYKKFGFEILKTADNAFLYGTGNLTIQFGLLLKKVLTKSPLDWEGKNWKEYYGNDDALLWVEGLDNNKIFLPQSVVISPSEAKENFNKIHIHLDSKDFTATDKNEKGLSYYRKPGDHNGLNARLKNYDTANKILSFQGAYYFDWVMTNLSMDMQRPPLPTLREASSIDGQLKPLFQSQLANITGINSLLFTKDGYMIYQKRNQNVLVRPGELCSGFSGTIDKIDIEHVCNSHTPTLNNVDVIREGVEEIGLNRNHIHNIVFLGLTRELIRGGTPELFFAMDINLTKNQVLQLTPKDKEGRIKSVKFGMYARSIKDSTIDNLSYHTLWKLMEEIEKNTRAPISIPFLTNLVLWYWHWDNSKVGFGKSN